ncbi:MAG TPA: RNA methyltransferase [Steroidobacteraceae bacterium]|nr:RNA methyltransferase [Steroidobacteraceae bacterium]
MKFDDIRKLHQKKFREELGHFLVEGEHLVQELEKAAARDARLRASEVYVTHEYAGPRSSLPTQVINARHMAQISETRAPQGIAAVVPLLAPAAPRAGECAIWLHEIQDPGNLGTILRTLAWFGNFRCLASPDSVDVHNAKVVRASMGAIFHVPFESDVALESLPSRYGRLAALDLGGAPLTSPEFRAADCFVFGNEARGLPRERMDALGARAFTIPGTGAIESLNVASSVNIALYEFNRRD